MIMSYCGCGYPYSYSPYQYSPYQYYGYPSYMTYPSYGYYPSPSYGLPLGYVYLGACDAYGPYGGYGGYPRGEHRVGNCLMIC